jgi:nitrous oxide reductase accessory protein NosL
MMMNVRDAAIAWTLAASSMIGCTTQARSPEPVPVDRVECARCRMLISSERGGGEILSPDEDTRFYDDIGCLAADWIARRSRGHAYVRLGNGQWSDAETVSYAQPGGQDTAMGSGLVAFATIAEARAADRTGRALTFDEVIGLAGVK